MDLSGGNERPQAMSELGPDGRQRAPTITIDTTSAPFDNTYVDYHPEDNRPTSPHNVSSPTTSRPNDTYLAVPGARSRGNSVDTDDATQSTSSHGSEALPSQLKPTALNGDVKKGAYSADPDAEHIINDEEALKPDPGTEAAFEVTDNKFAFSPGQLTKLINPKSLAAFYALGGLDGLEKGLRSDRQSGLSVDETHLDGRVAYEDIRSHSKANGQMNGTADTKVKPVEVNGAHVIPKLTGDSFADRKRIFGDNRIPEKKAKNIFQLAWIAYNDKILILLTIAAVISLALGLYETFGQEHAPGEAKVAWVEGVAIMVAILIVVVVGALNDWQKERQFVKLNKKKEDRLVKIIRSGQVQEVSVYDVFVGDVMHLEPGDLIPVDGILIDGHGVKCDESSATGESDIIKKQAGADVYRAIEAREDVRKLDPFILSGAKVTEGMGSFLVTAVGVHSGYGKTMMSLRTEMEATPLQSKLNRLAEQIAKLGGAAALLLFVILLIKFLVGLRNNNGTPAQKGQQFSKILITAVTVVVVAVPEGLPLAVTLALAFATTRMLKDNNLVRVLRACETAGNATTVCSDKTGTLTQNKMTVVAGCLGTSSRFGEKATLTPNSRDSSQDNRVPVGDKDLQDVTPSDLFKTLSSDVTTAFKDSIALNSTAFEGEEDGKPAFIGSKTETALLTLARNFLGMDSVKIERSNANIVQFVPFDSGRKCMASVVKLPNGRYRMYVKGASEIMLGKCTKIVADPTKGLDVVPMTEEGADELSRMIETYASRSLRTIGLIYRDYEQWPPADARIIEDDKTKANFDDVFKGMVFLAVVGIQDPLRDGVREAVRSCQSAGVFVRMVTGDNVMTARAIAEDCGIFTKGGIVMEGPKFRKLTQLEMDKTIPRLQVLARSSPEDKRILVKRLKELGETVAVTGDGTNDAPALKTADVGFSMGIAGTEVAKEASAIILMDDNFASIVKAIMWGRAVNDAVRKFLQFQLTVNVTAVALTFVSSVSSPIQEPVLKAVQLLWVNLIMDTFAALALATDPPTPAILRRKPDPKSAPLITVTMWKMILGQAVYQLTVTLVLFFAGYSILNYDRGQKKELDSLIFNTFVWMQIFNEFNNRRLDNKFNIFEGIQRNKFFIIINTIMVGGQVMIIFVGSDAFQVKRLNGVQWAISIILGSISVPVAVIIRLIPDELVRKILPWTRQKKKPPQLVVSDDDRFEWNPAIQSIREELAFLKRLRGGRLNAIKFKLQHPRDTLKHHPSRTGSLSRSSSSPQTPNDSGSSDHGLATALTPDTKSRKRTRSRSNSAFGPAAAMAGVVAGSIAGWSPIDRAHGEQDSASISQISGRADLENQRGVIVHPATDPADPVLAQDVHPSGDVPPSQRTDMTPAAASYDADAALRAQKDT